MFKPLTGTLKHGLAALIILTAGAGAALPTEDNSEDNSEDTAEDTAEDTSVDSSDSPVNATTWTDSFTDLPTERDRIQSPTDTSTAKNQFLADSPTELPNTDRPPSSPLTLGNAQYDNYAIGGDTTDGVDFFTISETIIERDENKQVIDITTTRYHYAGILSDTDLGAPLPASAPRAQWRGSFKTYNMNSVDFLLTVEFGATDDTRKISAFVKDSVRSLDFNYYHLTGNYNSAGLITGKVNWGTFSDIASRTPTGNRAANGILTGLIGAEGAVGVFVSGDSVDANGKVTGGTGPNTAQGWGSIGYAGGFVAGANVANNPNITFSDWADTFTPSLSNKLNTAQPRSEFLAGETRGLNLAGAQSPTESTTLNLSDSTFEGERFYGQSAYGVSFFYDAEPSHFYAGLLRNTDLGAPLEESVKQAFWHGQFQTIGDGRDVTTDFTLEIGFDSGSENRTLEAFVKHAGTDYYHLEGTFDDNGVITGTVDYGEFTNLERRTPSRNSTRTPGILTGLIGENGAVGVFIAGTGDKNTITGNSAYAGGFVAVPNAPLDPDIVNYNDWTRSFATPPLISHTESLPGEFLATREYETTLSKSNVSSVARISKTLTTTTATFEGVRLSEETFGGVSFFHNLVTASAGILHDTNLGAPLYQPSGKAFWYGQFQTIGWYPVNTDFTLEIDFDDDFALEAFVKRIGNYYFHLKGNFDDKGVITGTVDYGEFHDIYGRVAHPSLSHDDSILTGLIGEKGAVGVFINGTGDNKDNIGGRANYVGGFIAVSNPPGNSHATHGDWSRGLPAPPPEQLDKVIPRHQFLAGKIGATALDTTGSTVVKSGSLNIRGTTFEGLRTINNHNVDGVAAFFIGDVKGTRYGYAGLLNPADVGSPQSINATYKGQFRGILFNNNDIGEIATDFILTTDLTNRTLSFNVANTFNNGVFIARDVAIDENGAFSGSILHDRFGIRGQSASNAPDTVGSLSGIFGLHGVIGAFYGGTATTNSGFVGGFVARPSNQARLNSARVTFSDWVSKNWGSSANSYIATHTRLNPDTLRRNQFLAGGGATLDETGAQFVSQRGSLNLSSATHGGNRFWGDPRDGVAFFSNAGNYYAGLLSGTDLGAPLKENAASAEILYNGHLRTIGVGERAISSDLTIHLNFYAGLNNGNIAYINAGVGRYYLNGTIDRAGVLTGSAQFTPATGTAVRGPLTGLISASAAVGVFHSGATQGLAGFAGGFAARPVATADTCKQPGLAYYEFCQDIPLHLNQIPNLGPHFNAQSASLYVTDSVGSAYCNGSYCDIHYPRSALNIRPLNDSNTGTVTYSGQAYWAWHSTGFTRSYPYGRDHDDHNGKWTGCFNFDRCYVNYSASSNAGASGPNSFYLDFNFKYNTFRDPSGAWTGTFTDRGIITGNLHLGSLHGSNGYIPYGTAPQGGWGVPIIGYIGQDTAVGFWGGVRRVSHYGAGATERRAGGFILNRVRD